MNEIKTRQFLEKIKSSLDKYEEISKLTGENFNIFSILKVESNEVKTHSAFLGELLNPNGSHGLDDIPLKLFVQQFLPDWIITNEESENVQLYGSSEVKTGNFDTQSAKVDIEKYAGKINEDATEGGRIDIFICDKNGKKILIENKIYAPEQKNQLIRYGKAHPEATIFYLTLKGEESNTSGDLIKDVNFFEISYEEDVLQWLQQCLKEAVKFPMLREVINQYINLIKILTDQTMNSKLKNEISGIIKDNFLESAEVAKSFDSIKKEIADNFWLEVISGVRNKIQELCAEEIIAGNWKVEINTTLFKHDSDYFLITKNDDVFMYCRYGRVNTKKEEISYGIILNPKFLKPENGEIKGTKIKHDIQNKNGEMFLKLKNTKDGEHSVVYLQDKYSTYDKLNNQLIAKFLGEKTEIVKVFENRIIEFFREYLSVYDQVVIQLEKLRKDKESQSFQTMTPSDIS